MAQGNHGQERLGTGNATDIRGLDQRITALLQLPSSVGWRFASSRWTAPSSSQLVAATASFMTNGFGRDGSF